MPEPVDTREIFRRWLQRVLAARDTNATELARKAGLSPSTLTRALGDGKFTPSMDTVGKIVQATGIAAPPELVAATGGGGFAEPEASAWTSAVEIVMVADNRDAWQLKSRALDLAGCLPGDILLVDRTLKPRPRDIVCAQVYDLERGTAETVFREIDPPFLLTRSSDPATSRKPLLIDNERVLVMGVVLQVVRNRTV